MSRVAFLGTGLLGSAMVERMRAQHLSVTVWNRTPGKAQALASTGAAVAGSIAEAVKGASGVHIVVKDDAAVDDLLHAVVPALDSQAVVIDHSTTAPAGAAQRAERMSQAGVRFLHAPVFMSPPMARAGKGLMMVAGSEATFQSVQPTLSAMTGEVWYVGTRPDLAAAYKLFGNAMIFTIIAGVADVLAMADSVGLARTEAIKLFDKFQPGVAIPMRAEKMAHQDFTAMFELVMARKDIGLMIEAAGNQPLAVLPGVAERMDEAIGQGYGHDDVAAIGALGLKAHAQR